MMINDPLSDMIARIRNAHMRKRAKVLTPASRLRQRVLDVLQDEGYIRGYALVQNPGEFPQFEIELKYFDGQPVIAEIARVSKPGRRVYSAIGDLKPIKNGLGISILSTSKGVMSDVGGERTAAHRCRVRRSVCARATPCRATFAHGRVVGVAATDCRCRRARRGARHENSRLLRACCRGASELRKSRRIATFRVPIYVRLLFRVKRVVVWWRAMLTLRDF